MFPKQLIRNYPIRNLLLRTAAALLDAAAARLAPR